ncbi:MAG TPA: LD-carboxypeptidase [Bacteroidales bacterium]
MWNRKHKMITPPYLKTGDKVAIIATARKVSLAEMEPAIAQLKSWGLKVITGNYLSAEYNQFAGTDEERTADIQQMLDDADVKAIFCARGGYGSVRIIDWLDFKRFVASPKWIVGYSDITVFHSHINRNFGIETLHGTMPVNFPPDGSETPSTESLRKALFGEDIHYRFASHPLNRNGAASGDVIGGNLSMLYSLSASSSDVDTDGKILFFEDVDEYLYHIDRMMMNLKRSGKLGRLAGLVVGGMTKMNDNTIPYGLTAEEIVANAVVEYDFPVCFNFPAGHQDNNFALIMGRQAELSVADEVELRFLQNSSQIKPFSRLKSLLIPTGVLLFFFALLYLLYALLIKHR